jgi:hypothetical protein
MLFTALEVLPDKWATQLNFLPRMLRGNETTSGVLSLGVMGGRDFREGIYRAGISGDLTIRFSGLLDKASPDGDPTVPVVGE